MKKLLYLLLSLFIYTSAMAQTPGTFNYQAAIRDASGGILANEDVFINISILQGSSEGTVIYSEDWDTQTSSLGLVNLEIGSADPQEFATINWSNGPFFVAVSVDDELLGTSQLLSVPFAMQAQTVVNEKQNISLNGDQLSITNGSTITLPSGGTDQTLTIVGHDLTISGGNTITIPDRYNDADADSQNEIQDLDLTANVLTITGNASATDISLASYLDNTDDQTLSEILGVSTSAGDSKISSLANPTDDQDAATKIYVDDAVSDEAVRATAAEGVLTTAISDETDNRLSADETLQTAIDGKSDNGHDHNSAYYQKSESDANYLSINGGTLNGDLDVVGDVTAKKWRF